MTKKSVCLIIALIALTAAIAVGSVVYNSVFKRRAVEISVSPDGKYSLIIQSIGEPTFPFGRAKGLAILSDSDGEISSQSISLADDGCQISLSNISVTWDYDRVWLRLMASEQEDELWKLFFDGRIERIFPSDEHIESPQTIDLKLEESEDGIPIFRLNINELIECFNCFYRQEHAGDYLRPLENWDKLCSYVPALGLNATCYRFAFDSKKYTQPELIICMQENNDGIYQLALSFDEHGYREDAFAEYREMCYCALRCFLSEHDRYYVNSIFDSMYNEALTLKNLEFEYTGIHSYGDVGLYTFCNAGRINIGIVPLADLDLYYGDAN